MSPETRAILRAVMSVPLETPEPDPFREAVDAAIEIVNRRIRFWEDRRDREYPDAPLGQVETELVNIELELHALRRRGYS